MLATAYFDKTRVENYERRIRLLCPCYEAMHQMLSSWLCHLPDSASIISAGAGTGMEILSLGKQFHSMHFVAVESSSDMMAACKANIKAAKMSERVEFQEMPMNKYRSTLRHDAATSIFVSQFITGATERLEYFQAIASNLKCGATLISADLVEDIKSPEFDILLDAWMHYYALQGFNKNDVDQERNKIAENISIISEQELYALLNAAGFEQPIRFFQSFLWKGWIAKRA